MNGRMILGNVAIDAVTFEGAIERIVELVESGRGGTVFTPNVDHVVLADEDPRFRAAYARAALSLVDGAPVLWSSRLVGPRLPEKVSGSDLLVPLLRRARDKGWRVYFLGAAEGVAARAKERLERDLPGLNVVGVDSPRIDMNEPPGRREGVLGRVRDAKPHLVLVAMGAPKQELWSDEVAEALKPAAIVGIGASFDFIAGTARRAPAWMSRVGLEWAFRLGSEPRRLWKRYLVRDPKFLLILLRTLRERRAS